MAHDNQHHHHDHQHDHHDPSDYNRAFAMGTLAGIKPLRRLL